MNTRHRSWQVAVVFAATLVAGIVIGRSVLSEDAPDAGLPFVVTTTVTRLSQSERDLAAARRYVRYAVPAAEAFFADHRTYRGMTFADLHRLDAGIEQMRVAIALDTGYCLESTVGTRTASYVGSGGTVRTGPCANG
jgi:hypothetical protein